MNIQVSKTAQVKISLEELKNIISEHLKNNQELKDYNVEKISQSTRTEQVPGYDPHDCDYVKHFDGITVSLSK